MDKKPTQYSLVAEKAYKYMLENKMDAGKAWDRAARDLISSEESRKKGCPRNTFIGICNSGSLNNIGPIPGNDSINFQYAQFAIDAWKKNKGISKTDMWKQVVSHFNKAKGHQGQLDVVLGLERYLK